MPRADALEGPLVEPRAEANSPAEALARFARRHLRDILTLSGHVLYSSADTLRPGDVYLLGHNPGGSPEHQVEATAGSSLEALPAKTLNNYFDEAWTMASGRSFAVGAAPLQRRVKWLLEALGLEPRNVAASNMVFVRSVDAAGSRFEELARLCWPVHEQIISYVRPRALVVFGNSSSSPYGYLRALLGAECSEVSIDSGHSPWRCRSFTGRNGIVVIGLPHLSRYNVIGKSAVVDWANRLLGRGSTDDC
jgi:hypothetical protein